MATFSITENGFKVTITNNSQATPVEFEETAFISPTLVPSAVSSEVVPATSAFVPAFKSYFKMTINPGDTLEFVVKNKEEAVYYKNLKLDDCVVAVEAVEEANAEQPDQPDNG